MCYRTIVDAPLIEIEDRFNAKFEHPEDYYPMGEVNGFSHAHTPIIIDKRPDIIEMSHSWGLIPEGSSNADFRKNLLNCKVETAESLASFRDAVTNRCLIICTAFVEHRWEDEKGKKKTKHTIHSSDDTIFALGGLYSTWVDIKTGEPMHTYTIVTTQANKTMEYVHNNKKRMPIMLKKGDEKYWLDNKYSVTAFAYPRYEPILVTFAA